jgi:hypothetical protein
MKSVIQQIGDTEEVLNAVKLSERIVAESASGDVA